MILEASEIKKLWPAYNRSLKRFDHAYALYQFEDQNGYLRLALGKKKKYQQSIYSFGLMLEGYDLLRKLIIEFSLCPKLCFIQQNDEQCSGIINQHCHGACSGIELPVEYNIRVEKAIENLHLNMPTFIIHDEGRDEEERSFILMEKGQFYGMGYAERTFNDVDLKVIKEVLQPYPESDYVKNLIHQFAQNNPAKLIII